MIVTIPMRRRFPIASILLCVLVLTPITAMPFTESAESMHPWPWTGWWWPMDDSGNPNLFDTGGPMQKYDWFAGLSHTEGAWNWEINHHNVTTAGRGHCDGWSKASILEPEPSSGSDLGGIAFRIGD